MLEKLFTSKTRTRLLMLLLFNQKRDYHLRELARLVQTSPIHVAREMENLATLNLVKKTIYNDEKGHHCQQGRVRLHEGDFGSPLRYRPPQGHPGRHHGHPARQDPLAQKVPESAETIVTASHTRSSEGRLLPQRRFSLLLGPHR